MKILHLTDACSWSGGIEQLILLSRGLMKRNVEIFIGCDKKSRLFLYANSGHKLPVVTFDFKREINFQTIREIIHFAKKNNIDIIHAHHPKAHTLGLLSSLWLPGTIFIASRRVVFKIRNNPFSYFKYHASRIDNIVAVSEAVKKILLDTNIPAEKITVIHSVVDTERFNPDISGDRIRQEFKIEPGEILVGKIANYSLYKGHDIFLKSAQLINKKNPKTKFMLVGEGTLNNDVLQKLACDLGIEKRLICTGYRTDVPEIIAAFDVSVNASRAEAL
ncbi:glycosyltransferase, partial [Candidatus Desantisbacteria bacterium]|nr:glycosyltransferase [Candidatus Desantisbacteria bacterium]